ncbi:hypothetical protein ACI2K4_25510 [Micromonospora sp. NPDC050397]|uniref:hypothetical protein n=1 Tax=Micromonospora sp. NPDC050397 TaxID=3364279 RepID=UPI00384CE71D
MIRPAMRRLNQPVMRRLNQPVMHPLIRRPHRHVNHRHLAGHDPSTSSIDGMVPAILGSRSGGNGAATGQEGSNDDGA